MPENHDAWGGYKKIRVINLLYAIDRRRILVIHYIAVAKKIDFD